MNKIISFGIPCYNSAEYMDHCVESILAGSGYADDVQVIIVDDGSTKDDTLAKAKQWEERYPDHVKAVHQENGGHGMAVLAGLENADGTYYKVVDSDDWIDSSALQELLATLRGFEEEGERVDLVITNYVYEHVEDNKQTTIDYLFALPKRRIMGWKDIGHFYIWQNLLMHSLCYRTDILRDGGIPMPAHTFYVDNIYAFVPLPRCKTLYDLDVDLYRHYSGRDDQSVNEEVMASRIDQQLRVTRIMMESYHLYRDVQPVQLRSYMVGYFTIMMAVCSIFTKISDHPDAEEELAKLWQDLHDYDRRMWRRCRLGIIGLSTNLPTKVGEKTTLGIYHIAQKLVKFN
ncbi:MAG: glycosyltransferase family 2 protein [Atopobiaceae bacterium]|nr:glycosyltransferase family 2 protein [Atopobiaceae bacterium]